jgi:hypothetical protein
LRTLRSARSGTAARKIIKPVLAGLAKPKPGPKPKKQNALDLLYHSIQLLFQQLFQHLGFALRFFSHFLYRHLLSMFAHLAPMKKHETIGQYLERNPAEAVTMSFSI